MGVDVDADHVACSTHRLILVSRVVLLTLLSLHTDSLFTVGTIFHHYRCYLMQNGRWADALLAHFTRTVIAPLTPKLQTDLASRDKSLGYTRPGYLR